MPRVKGGRRKILQSIKFSFILVLVIFTYRVTMSSSKMADQTIITLLEQSLNKSFLKGWPFKERFPTFPHMKMSLTDMQKGIEVDGSFTRLKIHSLLRKALLGKNIHVVVLGTSISAGAELGCKNRRRTFHYGISKWWNKTIGSTTGSKLIIHPLAISGSRANYFSMCWKEYLREKEEIDFVIIELLPVYKPSLSDSESLTLLLKSVSNHWSRPGLLLVNFAHSFFLRDYFTGTPYVHCKRSHTQQTMQRTVASYSGITSINLIKSICKQVSSTVSTLRVRDMYNGNHPSPLAHAQMTFTVMLYVRSSLLSMLKGIREKAARTSLALTLNEKEVEFTTLKPRFQVVQKENTHSVCWTATKPDYRKSLRHPLFKLPVMKNKGFKRIVKSNWNDVDDIRYDIIGGYAAYKKGCLLTLMLNLNSYRQNQEIDIWITVRHTFFGGKIVFSIYHHATKDPLSKVLLDCSRRKRKGLDVIKIATVPSGEYELAVKTLNGGVLLTSVMLAMV